MNQLLDRENNCQQAGGWTEIGSEAQKKKTKKKTTLVYYLWLCLQYAVKFYHIVSYRIVKRKTYTVGSVLNKLKVLI